MNTNQKNGPSKETLALLGALRQAVAKELEKKRRLGRYVVFWKDGRPVLEGEDAPIIEDVTCRGNGA